MRLSTFAEKYNVTKNNIEVKKNQGALPPELFFTDNYSKAQQINEKFLLDRKAFRMKAKMFSQDVYYILEHTGLNDLDIAKKISEHYYGHDGLGGSIYCYLRTELWSYDDSNVLRYKFSKNAWIVFRSFWHLALRYKWKHGKFGLEKKLREIAES